jgi:hypothetical protein
MDNDLIAIASLQDRYSLNSRQAIYDRIAALKITPVARGKLSSVQVDKLDELNKFLKSTPGAAIADFPKSTEVVEMGKLDKVEMSSGELDKADNFTESLQLVEAIARHFQQQRDPLQHYAALERAIASGWLLSTAEVRSLIGTKPHGDRFQRGSFVFVKSGKIGNQAAWRVAKVVEGGSYKV